MLGSGGATLQQAHNRLPRVGRDLCLSKQKGFVSHMVVGKFFPWASVSARTRKCHPSQQGTVKVDVPTVSNSLSNAGEPGAFQIWNSQPLTTETAIDYFSVVNAE